MHDATTATTPLDLERLLAKGDLELALADVLGELARRRPEGLRPWESLGFRMDGDDDDDGDKDGDDDDDGDKDGDDDDVDVSDLAKAQAAAARFRKEARDLKRTADEREAQTLKDQGKHKERADKAEKELADVRAEREAEVKGNLLTAALKLAGFKNPATGLKLAKADDLLKDVDDEHDAKRVARDLAKENPDLVDKKPRQKRPKDDDDDDDRDDDRDRDDDDDDEPRRRTRSTRKDQPRGVDRIRAALDKESGKRKAGAR